MADIHVKAVLARAAWMALPDAAAVSGLHFTTVRKLFKLYQSKGIQAIVAIPLHRNLGKPNPSVKSDAEYNAEWIERIKSKCVISERDCWVWQGPVTYNGYGQWGYRGRNGTVHRRMFQVTRGVKLARLQYVCHSCDVKGCCNPDHLWLGDNGLNKKDETAKGTNYWANRTHCPKGHEYTPENTIRHECRPGVVSRGCKTCFEIRTKSPEYVAWRRAYQKRKRDEKRAVRKEHHT